MSTPAWHRHIEEWSGRAVRAWQAAHQTRETPRFWELSVDELDEHIQVQAAQNICGVAEDGKRLLYPRAACLFVFFLLRTRLTNVSGNRLWPEVAEELRRLACRPLDNGRCADFCRRALRDQFKSELESIRDEFFRFVQFSLDETGVGKDRSGIVTGFLEELVRSFDFQPSGPDPESSVERLLQAYLGQSAKRDNVKALERVLRRSGVALLRLAAALRSGGLPLEWMLADWTTLRQLWLQRSGVDLGRLLPEAREVFAHLAPRLADRLSREGLVRLLAEGRWQVEWPAPLSGQFPGRTVSDPRSIPLMPVRVHVGQAKRVLTITDVLGLSAEAVRGHDPGQWHTHGRDGVFFWQPVPFTVALGASGREPSVPLLCGENPEDARVVGHFWSGTLSAGLTPTVAGTGIRPQLPPRLRVAFEWLLEPSGLTLVVLGFRVDFLQGAGEATLSLEGQTLWQGEMSGGRRKSYGSEAGRRAGCQSAGASLGLALSDATGEEWCATELTNPAARDFLAVRGRVYPERGSIRIGHLVSDGGFPRGGIWLFCRSGTIPSVSGASLEKVSPGAAWRDFSVYRVLPGPGTQGTIRIASEGDEWRLLSGEPWWLELLADRVLSVGEVEVNGEDDLRLALAGAPPQVRLHGPETGAEEDSGDLLLFTSSATYRWGLAEVIAAVSSGRAPRPVYMGLADLAGRMGVTLPPGLLTLRLSGGQCNEEETAVFVVTGVWQADPARVGERPRLCLRHQEDVLVELCGDAELRWGDVQEHKRVRGWQWVGSRRLSASWHPPVLDAVLLRDGEPVPVGSALGLEALAGSELHLVGDGVWAVILGARSSSANSPATLRLAELLRDGRLASAREAELSATPSEGEGRSWTLDLRPVQFTFRLSWSEGDTAQGERSLAADICWFGLPGQELSMHLCAGDRELSQAQSAPPGSDAFPVRRRYCVTFGLLTVEILHLHGVLGRVEARVDNEVIATQALPPLPPAWRLENEPGDLRAEIRRLLETTGRTPAQQDDVCEQILVLCELHLRRTHRMPFANLDWIIARLPQGATAEFRQTAALGLRLLGALEEGGTSDEPYQPPVRSRLRLFLLTLWAIQQARLRRTGEANPRLLNELAGAFHEETRTGVPSLRGWARVLALFCRHIVAELQGGAPPEADLSPDELAFAARCPLVGVDTELTQWLSNLDQESTRR